MNQYTSPMTKPKIGAKPSFALKPMTLKKQSGPPLQTPIKYDGNGYSAPQQNMGSADEEIKTSPPEQSYGGGMPTSTPPPGPSQTRIQGTKQFAKPMKIQKKRFVMAAPERQENIPEVKQAPKSNSNFLQSPNPQGYSNGSSDQRQNSANRLNNNLSRGSLGSSSAQRLVEEKHLGPQIMKQKVGTAVAYNQWNQGPLPHGNQAAMLQGGNQVLNSDQNQAINKMKQGPNMRPASRMKGNPMGQGQGSNFQSGFKVSKQKSGMSNDGYSDEDYEEDFQDNANDDGGDEMERIRNAMAREKKKADKFQERQILNKKEEQTATKLKFQGAQGNNNPLQLNKNLDGFMKQKGLVIADRVDHMAVNRQQVRAKELRELLQLSTEEQFNMFEMVPQTPQDIYRNKLQSEVIKTQLVATNDDMIEQEVQTEDLGSVSIGTQKPEEQNPEELLQRYIENQSKTQAIGLGKRKNVDLGNIKLQKFLDQSEPIMQKVIEENQLLHFKDNRGDAANRNAVELKQNIKIPQEILYLFSEVGHDQKLVLAEIEKVSCIHTFESCPQSKCSIAYVIRRPSGSLIYLAIVFSTLDLQHQNLVVCNDEITQMCTTGRADVLICATKLGSFFLFDLLNIDDSGVQGLELNFMAVLQFKKPDFGKYPPHIQQELIQKCQIKYHVQSYSYMTDGLETFPHESQIQKLCFINISDGGISKIGAIDKHGIISVWSIVDHVDIPNSNYDLNVKSSSKFKMVPIFSDRLFDYPDCYDLFDEKSLQYVEIEFDPVDPQMYFFSTSLGLFKIHRNDEVRTEPQKMDTIGLNSPTALSLCDKGYLLAAFSCGSICLYDKNFTTPLTVWYQKAKCPITQIKWCQLYFDDEASIGSPERKTGKMEQDEPDNKAAGKGEQFSARLCEFFAIDLSEDFSIWNLQKSTQKPAHVIQFSEKHSSHDIKRMFRISTTCWDQSFFTAFALKDFSVNLYLMNFKKGSSISKEKLNAENKKSLRVIKKLPSNMVTQHDSLGFMDFADYGQEDGQIHEAPK